MTIQRVALLVAILAGMPAASALAQADTGAARGRIASKRIRTHATPRPGDGGRALSDFIKGTPAQQDLERRDNDLATLRPVDHRKDEFFSDWRGLR